MQQAELEQRLNGISADELQVVEPEDDQPPASGAARSGGRLQIAWTGLIAVATEDEQAARPER